MTAAPPDRPLASTPALERLLARLSRKLAAQVWLFGLGTLSLCCAGWILFAFFADYGLRVPRGVRLPLSVAALALPVYCLWRFLARPLRRLPDRAHTAVLLERARPATCDLFVSAVQLQSSAQPEGAPQLVAEVMGRAESEASSARLEGVLDERPARKRAALGAGSALAVAVLAFGHPDHARTFVLRLFDSSVRWPQRTHLTLEIPLPAEKAAISVKNGAIFVRVARGTDVPILVRARGAAPEEVLLAVADAGPLALSPSSDGTYRTVLRSLQQDAELRASGGDDDGSGARAHVEVLSPPDLAGLAVHVEPPAYTGRPARTEFDRDVEVLAGSKLTFAILTEPPEASARARILPADTLQALLPLPFPAREPEGHALEGRGFETVASESIRLRFELEDANGLTNPDPGLFAVRVVADEKPQVSIYAPPRVELDTLLGGWIALRARASDDFGIAQLTWSARAQGEDAPPVPRDLEWRALLPEEREQDETRPVVALGSVRVDVAALGDPARPVVEGAVFALEVHAQDNRPEGGDGSRSRSASLLVRVVSAEEFLRRVQDRLARVRLSVGELEALARDKGRRARELLASLESDAPESGAAAGELAALYAGARRVEGDARAIARELCSIAEAVLYARLDTEADAVLTALDAALARAPRSGAFPVEAWREFGASFDSGRGRTSLAGQLGGLVGLALVIDVDDAGAAAKAAERAAAAGDLAAVHAALAEHVQLDKALDQHIQDLLARLAEWDNFQSILSLTKDILNRQKALRERAKAALTK